MMSFLRSVNWKQKYDYKILKHLNYQPDKSDKPDKSDQALPVWIQLKDRFTRLKD